MVAVASAEPIALFAGISAWPTQAIRLAAAVLCIKLAVTSSRSLWLAKRRVATDFGATSNGSTTWTELDKRADLASRWRRTVGWSAAFLGAIVLTDLFFGLPNAPVRGAVAHWADAIVAWVSRAAAVVLLVFCIDAVAVRLRLIRWCRNHEVRFASAADEPNRAFHEKREIDYVAALTTEESRMVLFPFMILLILVCAKHRVFDDWHWNAPIIAVTAVGLLTLVAAVLILRANAEALRSDAVRTIDVDIAKLGHGNDEERARLLSYGTDILGCRTGVFATWAGNPVVQGLLIPLGGIGGMFLLEQAARQ